MTITCIAAMGENRVIGRDGGLPWHLPADLKRFQRATRGHTIIMGRRTWESLGKPLADRRHIVVSRRRDLPVPDGVELVGSFDEALEVAARTGPAEVFVVGGASIYAEAIPRADRLVLTLVHASPPGDVFFPEFDESAWVRVEDERRPADARNPHDVTFRTYER